METTASERWSAIADRTPAEQAALLEKARTARAAKAQARRVSPLRRDFLDAPEWERLASLYGVRLPPWGEPASAAVIRRTCKLLGRDVADYLDWTNEITAKACAVVTNYPARALAGLILEWHASEKRRIARAKQRHRLSGHFLTCHEIHGGTCKVPV